MNNKITVTIIGVAVLIISIFFLIPGPEPNTMSSHQVDRNGTKTKQKNTRTIGKQISEKIRSFLNDNKIKYSNLADYKTRRRYADKLYIKSAEWLYTLMDKIKDGTIENEPNYQRRLQLFNLAKDDPRGLLDAVDAGELDVNESTPNNLTRGLDILIITNRFAEAEELIARGALLDDDSSEPPYHVAPLIAASHATLEQIQFAASHGADMGAVDGRERNAFSWEIYYANLETAQYLHEIGVNAYPSSNGETPLDIALNNNRNTTPEIVEYLFDLGFKPCNAHLNSISEKNPNYIELCDLVERALKN